MAFHTGNLSLRHDDGRLCLSRFRALETSAAHGLAAAAAAAVRRRCMDGREREGLELIVQQLKIEREWRQVVKGRSDESSECHQWENDDLNRLWPRRRRFKYYDNGSNKEEYEVKMTMGY